MDNHSRTRLFCDDQFHEFHPLQGLEMLFDGFKMYLYNKYKYKYIKY